MLPSTYFSSPKLDETSSYLLPYLVRISFKFPPIHFVTHALLTGMKIRLLRLEQFFFSVPHCSVAFWLKKKNHQTRYSLLLIFSMLCLLIFRAISFMDLSGHFYFSSSILYV